MQCLLPSFSFVLVFLAFVLVFNNVKCFAAAMTDIRVGLTSLYGKKDHISIYNNSVDMGYCYNNAFVSTDSFYSSGGFTFETDKKVYYILPDKYTSYKDAKKYADKLLKSEIKAIPAATDKKVWQIYIEDGASVPEQYLGYTKTNSNSSDASRIKVSFSDGAYLMDNSFCGRFPQFKPTDKGGALSLGTRSYRGRIEIVTEKQTLTAINIISIEAYLLGVVTCEMDRLYPEEALKAQTVAARSYALVKAGFMADGNGSSKYKLTDNTYSQVYKGINGETEQSLKAVTTTIGEVLKRGNQVVEAFYFSTSGGSTESSSDIWNVASPVYQRVFDKYERNPERLPWTYDYSLNDIEDILKENGVNIGTIKTVKPYIRTAGLRVYSLKITGSKKSVILDINKIQDYFGLPSTKFNVITSNANQNRVFVKNSDSDTEIVLKNSYTISGKGSINKLSDSLDQYILISEDNMYNVVSKLPKEEHIVFAGMGYGHGVGMSQAGAAGMAEEGFNYKEILMYYYNGVRMGNYND